MAARRRPTKPTSKIVPWQARIASSERPRAREDAAYLREQERARREQPHFITVVAVIEVPQQIADESDDQLTDSLELLISNGWPTVDAEEGDVRRLIALPRFASVHHGVTETAIAAGADPESW